MSRLIRMVGRVGFAAAVVTALAFGAAQSLAGASRTDDCQPCATQGECHRCCQGLGFDGGDCYAPNCLCY